MIKKNKGGKIVLFIFLFICSGLGIAAFIMSFIKCKKDGFTDGQYPTFKSLPQLQHPGPSPAEQPYFYFSDIIAGLPSEQSPF